MSLPLLGIYADAAAAAAQDQASTNFASVTQLQTEVLRLDQLLLGKETTISGTNPVSLSETGFVPLIVVSFVSRSWSKRSTSVCRSDTDAKLVLA